ncbi:MAG: HAD family phosphatase [Bacteroidales bacterium]|jgi:2-haloacid dehalogenase
MSIKNIIFDFGGVLVDWNPKYVYENIFQKKTEMDFFLKNICSPLWINKQDAGESISETTKELQLKHPEYREEIEMFYRDWEKMLGGEITENTRLIKTLKSKYKIYGLSNWSAETFPIAFKKYPFFSDFDGIVLSGQEKMVKPDSRIFKLLLNRYSLKAEESLFIDDNMKNVITAKEIGFLTILLTENINLNKKLTDLGILC